MAPRLRDEADTMAWAAVYLLLFAYQRADEGGGSVDWADLDAAHSAAQEALRLMPKPTGALR